MTRAAAPVGVTEARERALAHYDRRCARWATGEIDEPAFDIPLHPPTESAAIGDVDATIAWSRSWLEVPGVVRAMRRWANLGDQEVPERLRLERPQDVAGLVGRDAHWRTLHARADELGARWGDVVLPAVRRHARAIAAHDDLDHARLVAVVDWLVAHPASGMYLRQLPVSGVDTKWLGTRQALVGALVTARSGSDDLGLRRPPGLVRVRFLDPVLAPGGLRDLAAPVAVLDQLAITPRRVLVVENLESLLALPDADGTVALHGAGYAIDRLAAIGWVRDASITYWGDLDHDGFAIVDRLRAHCPEVMSVLMDTATVYAHRDLWVPDPYHATRAAVALSRLTEEEGAAFALLRELGGIRLEQERLPWPTCLVALGL